MDENKEVETVEDQKRWCGSAGARGIQKWITCNTKYLRISLVALKKAKYDVL
jgi:hypothetical protein